MAGNRDALFTKINKHAEACLARPLPELPRLREWLKPTPGIIFDTNSNAPPIIIGFVCQAMMGITPTDEARTEQIGKMVVSALGNPNPLGAGVSLVSARDPQGTVGGAIGTGGVGGAAP
ncbi:MAG: hypothetical protein JSR77_02550 [Planctomycetes bacterium]|nr:hypothetical protein [Planctomycetota bacterium]